MQEPLLFGYLVWDGCQDFNVDQSSCLNQKNYFWSIRATIPQKRSKCWFSACLKIFPFESPLTNWLRTCFDKIPPREPLRSNKPGISSTKSGKLLRKNAEDAANSASTEKSGWEKMAHIVSPYVSPMILIFIFHCPENFRTMPWYHWSILVNYSPLFSMRINVIHH